jgi:hypothetical protein
MRKVGKFGGGTYQKCMPLLTCRKTCKFGTSRNFSRQIGEQALLEELDLIHFVLILTIVSIKQLQLMSIIASKLGFTLVHS